MGPGSDRIGIFFLINASNLEITPLQLTPSNISCLNIIMEDLNSKCFGFWFGLMLNILVNNFSVMLGQSHRFQGITINFLGNSNCLDSFSFMQIIC